MPDRVREHVVPLSQRLPDDPDNAKESLSQRFQNVVGILNELNKANREVIVASEVRTLADGTSAEVAALYVGVGQAYYATVNGTDAGTGTPGPDGWKWAPANDAAAAITAAIAILRNEQVAGFERLPVRIQ
jgi:hypothetical protein